MSLLIDKFGNTLAVGDTVVYFSTGYSQTARIGLILAFTQGSVRLRTDGRREITRSAGSLIHYTGIANGI